MKLFVPVPPLLTVRALDRVRPPKVGVAEVLMFWIVLITPLLALKLVLLKAAIPLVEPSARALSIVMVPLLPLLLARVRTPV